MRPASNKVTRCYYLPERLWGALEVFASETGTKKNWILGKALDMWLNRITPTISPTLRIRNRDNAEYLPRSCFFSVAVEKDAYLLVKGVADELKVPDATVICQALAEWLDASGFFPPHFFDFILK